MLSSNFLKKFGLVAGALVIIAIVVFIGLQKNTVKPLGNNILPVTITNAGDNAFGKIVFSAQTASQNGGQEMTSDKSSQSPAVASAPSISGKGGTTIGIAMPYLITNYNYVYKGEKFDVNSDGLVYRRNINNSAGSNLASVISKMNFGLDLNKFTDLKVNSMEISEDRQFGYSLYIDLRQNTFSINMNWEKWPVRENYSAPSEMPADERIIAIADKFLLDYGIDMSGYGKGQVIQNQAVIMYGKAEPSISTKPDSSVEVNNLIARPYTDYASVTYPLEINGQTVYDQGGQKYGLTVGIDLGYNKVTSVYNINSGNFESSKYDIETDTGKLIKIAENGGIYGNYYYGEGGKNIDVELGTPKQGLVIMWKTEEGKSYGTEIFVPALIFPVKSISDQPYFYRNNVVVPLVGEMINNQNGGIPVPSPMPIPLETKPAG